jgi:serine/threonine protein phosphatase 1
MSVRDKFALLRRASRVWAVASIHGEAERLTRLHGEIERRFQPGDRLVYLGNAMGHGAEVRGASDELLGFRRRMLARPGMFLFDIAFLRGAQEEMWQKLLQLQFAPNPREVFGWMVEQDGPTLSAMAARPGLCRRPRRSAGADRWISQLR